MTVFSKLYLKKNNLTSDSVRFRRRIYQFFNSIPLTELTTEGIAQNIEINTGVKFPTAIGYDYEAFFEKSEIRDILDSITIIYKFNGIKERRVHGETWLEFVKRIFSEEELNYRVDDQGLVHYYIDEEFEQSRAVTILGLDLPEYLNAKHSFLSSHSKIRHKDPDTKGSLRDIFDAVETLFKKRGLESNGTKTYAKGGLVEELTKMCISKNINHFE
jgi:hypothetical protein